MSTYLASVDDDAFLQVLFAPAVELAPVRPVESDSTPAAIIAASAPLYLSDELAFLDVLYAPVALDADAVRRPMGVDESTQPALVYGDTSMSYLDSLFRPNTTSSGGDIASALATATSAVDVSGAGEPTRGDVLTALDRTHADWLPPELGDANSYEAAQPVSILHVVRLTAGDKIVHARPPELEARAPLGIATQGGIAGALLHVASSGELSDPVWAFTPGAPVLLGDNGTLVQAVAPDAAWLVVIGYALDAHTLVIRIGLPINLVQ